MQLFFNKARMILVLPLLFLAFFSNAQQFFTREIAEYLTENRSKWKLTTDDIGSWVIADQYTLPETGVTYTYLQQTVNGIPIFNAVSSMAIRDGKVVHFANRFQSDAAARVNSTAMLISGEAAISAAAAHLGRVVSEPARVLSQSDDNLRLIFSDCGIAKKPIKTTLYFEAVGHDLMLVWNTIIAPKNSADWWNIRVNALTGEVVKKNNWTLSCDFGQGHQHRASCLHEREQAAPSVEGVSAGSAYNVFEIPLEAPTFGARTIAVDPHSIVSSPFGWHDTTGVEGAEFTITRGNNVYAYDDRNNDDLPGYSPDGGADLNFDFALDPTQGPVGNRDAIITNLFYVNNMLHDILYLHGFTEAAGNFQAKNYSGAGLGNDYVLAEAQDGGGTNNANFSTPDDGENGVMQMYLWPGAAPGEELVKINAPMSIAGAYEGTTGGFNPDVPAPITGNVALIEDNLAPTTDGCDSIVNPAALAGKIAIIDRGICPFVNKVMAAEAAGAIAVVIVNNVAGAPINMGGTGTTGIPAVMVSMTDGNLIKTALANGEEVNMTLSFSTIGNSPSDRDGSLDNGIVMHEYGHGLSNRLTGGPSNSGCLFNGEQGGEGWSDWLALILTIEPGDVGGNSRGIGTYALAEPTSGGGIRRFPYSTNMSINPQTYADLATSQGVHAIGEIWSQTLWDMTWKLIDAEGFDPDWYAGDGGNNVALRLVLEGMRLQPCGPGYIDARDAILAADEILYNNAHRCLIWEAFAGRGMGYSALQGSADATGDELANNDLPPFCLIPTAPPIANFSVNNAVSCFGEFQFKDLSTNTPQEWLWNFGDGTTSTAINPSHVYTTAGVYAVTLTVNNSLGTDEYTLSVTFEPLPSPVVSGDLTICAGNAATITANTAPGNSAVWTLNGSTVFTGPTLVTPVLNANTVYEVTEFVDFQTEKVGPQNNTFGAGSNHNTGFDGRLLFEAFKPLTIASVLVYAQGAGERTISLYKENGALVDAVTVMVPDGASRVTLNLVVPEPGKYSLSNVSQNLYRNNSGANYPYTVNNLIRIYSSNATTDALAYYYYFYDWEVMERGCTSVAAPVTIEVVPGPVAGYSFVLNGTTANFTNTSTGNQTVWNWNFGDGSISSEQNPTHTYVNPGTYVVTLSVSNANCTSTFTQEVVITTSSAEDLGGQANIKVFPNPAKDFFFIQLGGSVTGMATVEILDAAGKLVLQEKYMQPGKQIKVVTQSLPDGFYEVRVGLLNSVYIQPLVIGSN